MGNFDRGNRGGGGRRFDRRDSGGRSFDRPREMYKVTCSECGKETEVPFRPTGDRPVYCRACFAKMGGPAERRSFGDRNDSRPSFRREERSQAPGNSAQLDAINYKLDQLIKLLTPKKEVKADEQVPEVVKTRSKISGREKKVAKKTPEIPEAV